MLTVIPLLLLGVGAAAQESAAFPGYYPVESYPLEEASVRARCAVGARRRFDYTQCSSYEECVADGKSVTWKEKKCHNGYAFNDGNGNCERDEKCATVEDKCSTPFIRLSCSELLVCAPQNGAYIRTNCDDGYRNEYHGGCIPDARCTTKCQNDTCKDGQARSTANCRTYSICEGGHWIREQCMKGGRWTEYCSECDPEYKPRECKEGDSKPVNHTEPFEGYGIDTTEIIDCARYEVCDQGRWSVMKCDDGTGYNPSMKRCTPSRIHDSECNPPVTAPRCEEGTRIVPPHSCSHFLQCHRGEWRQMACPVGSRFDTKKNRCVKGVCHHHKGENVDAEYKRPRGHHRHSSVQSFSSEEFDGPERNDLFFAQKPILIPAAFPSPPRRLNGAPQALDSSHFSSISAHRPGYLGQPEPAVINHHHHQQPYPVANPSGPSYPSPLVLPQYPAAAPAYPAAQQPIYEEGRQPPSRPGLICEGDFQVADPFDSAFYYDCVKGYLKRRACPGGSTFDPQRSKCLKEYSWNPKMICYDNQVMPTAYCGEYKICRGNEWLSGMCPHDWPFINGQCNKKRTCKAIAPPRPVPLAAFCAPGSVRLSTTNPHEYYECNYNYRWEKRTCQAGGVFDQRSSRCVSTTPEYTAVEASVPSAAAYAPVCYEGQVRKDEKYCTKYEICHVGRWEDRYCPYGSGFNGFHCETGYKCPGDSGVEGTCQESAGLRGFLPDRTDCAFFYQCAQGRWIRMPCAPGTHYSPILGICDHIGNVPGCGWHGPRPTHY